MMLKSLYVKSFVIIDEMSVDFEDGMSVLTGETGAGKSIIIDAIMQLCGARASNSFVRKGENKAIITGLFEVDPTPELNETMASLGLDEDEEINITKEIYANGKSSIKINYRPMTNGALKALAPYLIHVHSQFATQSLFSVKNHLSILDEYIGDELNPVKEAYLDLYKQYVETSKKIRQIEEEDFSDEQIEYYQSQYQELEGLSYSDEDVEAMENELEVMKNFESLSGHIQAFDQALDSSQGALEAIHSALSSLEAIKDMEEFSQPYDDLYNLYYNLSDLHDNVMNTYQGFDFDEYRFNELQEILYNLQRLKRKYGYTMEDLYTARDELADKIEAATHREEILEKLKRQQAKLEKEAKQAAEDLQKVRAQYANTFEKQIKEELNDLYLPHAKFKVDFAKTALSPVGAYNVTFMVAMNEGQNFTPLNESASGGEISRLMLAIKTIILAKGDVDTVIFDEVDTGVSGKVASSIGEKMAALGQSKQVICITHLPQVAVNAAHHYAIIKRSDEEATYSSIKPLTKEERVEEIAKMLSGEAITPEAMDNARRLLKHS